MGTERQAGESRLMPLPHGGDTPAAASDCTPTDAPHRPGPCSPPRALLGAATTLTQGAEVDPAVVLVLFGVESHRISPPELENHLRVQPTSSSGVGLRGP
jgi:hypothetical protein